MGIVCGVVFDVAVAVLFILVVVVHARLNVVPKIPSLMTKSQEARPLELMSEEHAN